MIVESTGRVFHMHIEVETEDGPDDFAADVVLEPTSGLLMVSSGGVAATAKWPDPTQWGTRTFEEFLCSRTPSWLVSKLLGQDALIFDEDRTRDALREAVGPHGYEHIEELIRNIDDSGEVMSAGGCASRELDNILEEPCDGFIFMVPTGFADFLIEGVLPTLLSEIAPPPIVTNQTHLKLC